jgi:hypothetical protein
LHIAQEVLKNSDVDGKAERKEKRQRREHFQSRRSERTSSFIKMTSLEN